MDPIRIPYCHRVARLGVSEQPAVRCLETASSRMPPVDLSWTSTPNLHLLNNEPHNEGRSHCKFSLSTMRALGSLFQQCNEAHCATMRALGSLLDDEIYNESAPHYEAHCYPLTRPKRPCGGRTGRRVGARCSQTRKTQPTGKYGLYCASAG